MLNVDNKGTGTLAPISGIKFNKNKVLDIESFGMKSLRLANVRPEKSSGLGQHVPFG